MSDRFQIQREMDNKSNDLVEEFKERLEEHNEKAKMARQQLTRLDDSHYFNASEKQLLLKVGNKYRKLNYNPSYLRRTAEKVEEEVKRKGFKPVKGGFFWDPVAKQLYIRNAERYVLYALNRRKRTRRISQRRAPGGLPRRSKAEALSK